MNARLRILVHDFAGHPFPVQLSRSLARRGYRVMHVYSPSIQTPKGALGRALDDSINLEITGISQEKPFPKYSLVKRWFSERAYAKRLVDIAQNYRPDVVISANTPLDIQKVLLTHCRKKKARFVFWVQDIYSSALRHVFGIKLPLIGSILYLYYNKLEKALLSNSHHVVVISDDFKRIIRNWTNLSQITVIENWAPLNEVKPRSKSNEWSVANGLADKFCFLYAGTMGMKHHPSVLLQLARRLKNDHDTLIAVISEGIGVERLKKKIKMDRLENIKFFSYLDFNRLPLALSSADVLMAILDKTASEYCVPSKVLTYHCIGKPLLLSVPADNLASRIVKYYQTGIVVDSGDAEAFCRSAERLKNDGELRLQMGVNARRYAERAFDIDKKVDAFIRLIG